MTDDIKTPNDLARAIAGDRGHCTKCGYVLCACCKQCQTVEYPCCHGVAELLEYGGFPSAIDELQTRPTETNVRVIAYLEELQRRGRDPQQVAEILTGWCVPTPEDVLAREVNAAE